MLGGMRRGDSGCEVDATGNVALSACSDVLSILGQDNDRAKIIQSSNEEINNDIFPAGKRNYWIFVYVLAP